MQTFEIKLPLTWAIKEEYPNDKTLLVARCNEYDLCVQGDSYKQIGERIDLFLSGHIMIRRQIGLEPLKNN